MTTLDSQSTKYHDALMRIYKACKKYLEPFNSNIQILTLYLQNNYIPIIVFL